MACDGYVIIHIFYYIIIKPTNNIILIPVRLYDIQWMNQKCKTSTINSHDSSESYIQFPSLKGTKKGQQKLDAIYNSPLGLFPFPPLMGTKFVYSVFLFLHVNVHSTYQDSHYSLILRYSCFFRSFAASHHRSHNF